MALNHLLSSAGVPVHASEGVVEKGTVSILHALRHANRTQRLREGKKVARERDSGKVLGRQAKE